MTKLYHALALYYDNFMHKMELCLLQKRFLHHSQDVLSQAANVSRHQLVSSPVTLRPIVSCGSPAARDSDRFETAVEPINLIGLDVFSARQKILDRYHTERFI